MGLNWQMQKKENYRHIWQSAGTAGFTSLLSFYPEDKMCFVLLANEYDENSQGELSKIGKKLFESLKKLNHINLTAPKINGTKPIKSCQGRM
jgi:hypothetical protein